MVVKILLFYKNKFLQKSGFFTNCTVVKKLLFNRNIFL